MRSSAPRRSRISSTTARYSRSSVRRRTYIFILWRGFGVLVDGHFHSQRARRVGVRGSGHAPRHAFHDDGRAAAGNAHALDDVGDDADARELAIGARNEQDALLVPGLHRQGGGHPGEKDRVFKGDESQVFHGGLFHSGSPGSRAENDYSYQRFVANMICS